mgnify:CR=1 FL=1
MSAILYYSTFCNPSKALLKTLSTCQLQNELHFICIDNRIKDGGKTYIQLETGQRIVFPETVRQVPALLLLHDGYPVLYGADIMRHLAPRQTQEISQATMGNMEPETFSFEGGGMGGSSVQSDQFSFYDQSMTELAAEGNGGERQMHHYSTPDADDSAAQTRVFNQTYEAYQKFANSEQPSDKLATKSLTNEDLANARTAELAKYQPSQQTQFRTM